MSGEPEQEAGATDLVRGQVLAACREGECPVCFRVAGAARKRLAALLAEHATDSGTRQRLRQARGFCAPHTWLLATVAHANLGVALIYHDLLQDALARLEQSARRPGRGASRQMPRRSPSSHNRPEIACPICREGEAHTASDLGVIVMHFADPQFQAGFARSAGLCLPHLLHLADCAAGHPNLHRVVAWHISRWAELDRDLVEFARKCDYRYAMEPMGRERDSWLRVLQVFAGKPERCWPDRLPYTSEGEPRNGD